MEFDRSHSDEGEIMEDIRDNEKNKRDKDEEEVYIDSASEDDGIEDSLNIKPPQSSKSSRPHSKTHSSRHRYGAQGSKHDRHSKKARRSKERQRTGRETEQSARYLAEHRSRDVARKHRHHEEHRVDKEASLRGYHESKDGRELKDAREILKKIREDKGSRDKRDDRDFRRDHEKEERENLEREKRRERLMIAEREREQRFQRHPDERIVKSVASSAKDESRRIENNPTKERSRSPVSRRSRKEQLNEKLREKLNAIKSEKDEPKTLLKQEGYEELVVTINDDEEITSDENNSIVEEASEKEEGEHSDEDEAQSNQEEVENQNASDSGSNSSSDGDTVEDEESSSDDSESEDGSEEVEETSSKEEKNGIESEGEENNEQIVEPESPVAVIPKLPPYLPAIQGCRSVEEFHCLNRIEEGTFGVVYRARDKKKDEIVALKRLKMENEKEGFPITSLREINTLLKAQHVNIVTCREIVVGSNMDKIYIVMDYVEHDLKSLMEGMKQPFLIGEVKTLLIQLLRAVAHLHDNWILHRDLKTSNLLLSHKGILKVGDFGLAREYGSPLKQYTPIVVTLWYRAPELLLGVKEYSCPIDMWSVGCIMAEFLNKKPLFPGKSEMDQLNKIFKDLGTPSEMIWPGYSELPMVKKVNFSNVPYNTLRSRFGSSLDKTGFELLNRFLTYDPKKRNTAEESLNHEWFKMAPKPVNPSMFPTWPAKSEQSNSRKAAAHSPKPPSGGKQYKLLEEADEGLMKNHSFHMNFAKGGSASKGFGFTLKF